jgi:hypothetical protein
MFGISNLLFFPFACLCTQLEMADKKKPELTDIPDAGENESGVDAGNDTVDAEPVLILGLLLMRLTSVYIGSTHIRHSLCTIRSTCTLTAWTLAMTRTGTIRMNAEGYATTARRSLAPAAGVVS